MRCLYCQKRIGIIRRFTDREYCSRAHRRLMLSHSARALRAADSDEFDEVWPVYLKPLDPVHNQKQASQSSLLSTALFGGFIIIALLVGSMGLSGPDSPRVQIATGGPVDKIRQTIKNHSAVRLTENFQAGLKSWKASDAASEKNVENTTRDWSFNHGFAEVGRMRLWKDSMHMSNYQIEFVGQIEKKGLGWAYRAADANNFYATKIQILKPGPLPTADLLRYAVIHGRENSHVRLPLPLVVRTDTLYHVQMGVKDDTFSTIVNGQMVDTWTDSRLRGGGIGFFTDSDEKAMLRWVTVSDRDTILGRMLSYLGFMAPIQPEVYQAILPTL